MSQPLDFFSTANLEDDDGQVIDSLLVEVDNPPDLREAVEPITIPETVVPTPVTRLIGGYIQFPQTTGAPTMLLQADKNRKSLHLRCLSSSATPSVADSVFISDELSKIQYVSGPGTSATPIYNGVSVSLDEHTGALWAAPAPTLSGSITLTWVAVTI